ncbi:hypothetical protein C8J56DRAFT_1050166 [Mycena floridula]|nr:hypothetical protein C8J56DRAFT_1050166 [Mycena floridula]
MIRCKTGLSDLGPPIQPGFILPHLHTLRMYSNRNDKCIAEVIGRLKLPLLQDLSLRTSFFDLNCFSALVQRSSCRVQRMIISSEAVNQRITGLLEIFPDLEPLGIYEPNDMMIDHVTELLSTEKKLVPNLRMLQFRCPGPRKGFSIKARPELAVYRVPP